MKGFTIALAAICMMAFVPPPPASEAAIPLECATERDALLHECADFIVTGTECWYFDWGYICMDITCDLTREYTRTITHQGGIGIFGTQVGATITESEIRCEYGPDGECGDFNAAATH